MVWLVAGGAPVPRLQCPFHVCDGVCGDDLPIGIYVSCNPTAAHLHGVGRTGEFQVLSVFVTSVLRLWPALRENAQCQEAVNQYWSSIPYCNFFVCKTWPNFELIWWQNLCYLWFLLIKLMLIIIGYWLHCCTCYIMYRIYTVALLKSEKLWILKHILEKTFPRVLEKRLWTCISSSRKSWFNKWPK